MRTNHPLESLFKTSDGVFAVDLEQRIIFWNQWAEAPAGQRFSAHGADKGGSTGLRKEATKWLGKLS
jgi:hypothetical protein